MSLLYNEELGNLQDEMKQDERQMARDRIQSPPIVSLGTGDKDDKDKPRYDLISPIGLRELANVYTFGSIKYAPRNWEKGISFSKMFAALMRHAWNWWSGLDMDEESGLHPLAHAAFWCFAIIHLGYTRPMVDDRTKTI